MNQPTPAWRRILTALLLFSGLGVIGALPFALMGLLFGSGTTALEVLLLVAIILGSWLPIKAATDSVVKGQSLLQFMPARLSLQMLPILYIGFMVMIPVLYFTTGTALLIALVIYALTAQNLVLALIGGLFVQVANLYQQSQREKATGAANNIFVHFQDMGGATTYDLRVDGVRQQQPRPAQPPRLREQALYDEDEIVDAELIDDADIYDADDDESRPDVITIDSAQSRRSEDGGA